MRTLLTTILALGLMSIAVSAARADTYACVNKSSGEEKMVASCTVGTNASPCHHNDICTDLSGSGTRFPATGQTTKYAAGDDGDIKAGAALSYTDNGDGTITDNNTKLMWEKKDEAGGLHDMNNYCTWAASCSVSGAACGTDADCGVSGGTCSVGGGCSVAGGGIVTIFQWVAQLNSGAGFAGHTDWRVPNVKELQSIVDYQNYNPAVDDAFNTSCSADCTVTTCSCTQSGEYWSATTYAGSDALDSAWYVHFLRGGVTNDSKANGHFVRAVRGGL
jgi:Protein of unknown function (DUF1566)